MNAPDPYSFNLPENDELRWIREALDLSQRQAAELAGIDHSVISRVESGESSGSLASVGSMLDVYRDAYPDKLRDRKPIEKAPVPAEIAIQGKAQIARHLSGQGYPVSEIAELYDVEPRTIWQYVSDAKAGRR